MQNSSGRSQLKIARTVLQNFSCDLSPKAKIGDGLSFPHPLGIVIGKGVITGENLTLFQNVTLGSKNNSYPKIGNNVVIYPNSVVVGNINIGNNVTIGANSFVDIDIPDDCIVAGNPARVIKKN